MDHAPAPAPPQTLDHVPHGLATDVLALVSPRIARRHRAVPLERTAQVLTVGMVDPTDVVAIEDLRFVTGLSVEPVGVTEGAVRTALDRYYPETLDPLPAPPSGEGPARVTLRSRGSDGPRPGASVVELVDDLLAAAIDRGASDVHLEPLEHGYGVRLRIDGVLHPVSAPPAGVRDALASRVKVLARLDVAERRLPQDGRIAVDHLDDRGVRRHVDLRVSTLPTVFGERLVLRVLDRSRLLIDLDGLGFEPRPRERFEVAVSAPWGLVLVTGPTGSGKTSTLYAALARRNTPEVNILTVEDPVELHLPGVSQLQVRDAVGLDFATALRAFLRQDPDVILVGEIRDVETARVATRAALTGHLVLSTLHTNDAPSAVTRLVDMGVERHLVASALRVVCAQRLVRRRCAACGTASRRPPSGHERPPRGMPSGSGCRVCDGTGYRGRIGLFEVAVVTDALRELIGHGAPVETLRRQAVEDGMTTLRQSGRAKVAAGVTTTEEVSREIGA